MSFLPRDARSANAELLSYVVRPSVRPSVCPSVTLLYRGHIGWTYLTLPYLTFGAGAEAVEHTSAAASISWTSSKLITRIIS